MYLMCLLTKSDDPHLVVLSELEISCSYMIKTLCTCDEVDVMLCA